VHDECGWKNEKSLNRHSTHTARGYINDREEQPKLLSRYKIDYKGQVIGKL